MAKKGQPALLQAELNNDEEWEKFLQKDGLIVVDVYSDWCGPCLGMQANLKKIKLEYGGDLLQLAVAKSDGITVLERFRGKSEPTWMFISKGKMIALIFGANAPQLRDLIIEELKKEQAQMEGQPIDRAPMEVTDLAEEERVRYEAAENKRKEMREKEERKKAKELLERRTKECENILTNLPNYGCVLIFPSAKDKYKEVLHDILDEAGLLINHTEKLRLDEHTIETLCFFTDVQNEFSEEAIEELTNNSSLMLLLKVSSRAEIEDIDDAILTLIYGNMKHPPGAPESPAQLLIHHEEKAEEHGEKVEHSEKVERGEKVEHSEKVEHGEHAKTDKVGVWVPLTPQVRATALSMFFRKLSGDFIIPEPPPEPEHLAIVFDMDKKNEVLQIMQQYSSEIMQHGIFTSEDPDDTIFICKTIRQLEKMPPKNRTHQEKLVLQVSKKKSECILLFAQLEPVYMSPNAKEGKEECQKFFPEDYEPETEEQMEEEIEEEMEAAAEEGEETVDDQEIDVPHDDVKEGVEGEIPEGEVAEQTEGEHSVAHTPHGSGSRITPPPSDSAVEAKSSEVQEPPSGE